MQCKVMQCKQKELSVMIMIVHGFRVEVHGRDNLRFLKEG